MKNLTIALLCAGLVKSACAIPQSNQNNVEVEWGEKSYTISYMKNGSPRVMKGQHNVPGIDAMVLDKGALGATDPDAVITSENMNYRLLDSLTWVECNRYRATKNLPAVAWNRQIEDAASHHSYYQQFYSSLQHGEEKDIPHRQLGQDNYQNVYGGAAEICLYNWAELGDDTYREVAKRNIKQWENSPGHNAIMISESYRYNGFGNNVQYASRNFINREMLAEYNPTLLAKIEREVPEALELAPKSKSVKVWSTGNFRYSPPKELTASTHAVSTLASEPSSSNDDPALATGQGSRVGNGSTSSNASTRSSSASRSSSSNRNSNADKKKSRGSKSGYTVLPRHPNAKSGMARLKRNKYRSQAGNGGRNKTKRQRGHRRNQHRGCDAYM